MIMITDYGLGVCLFNILLNASDIDYVRVLTL